MVSPKLMLARTSCQFQLGMDWAFPDHLVLFGKKWTPKRFVSYFDQFKRCKKLPHVRPALSLHCSVTGEGRRVQTSYWCIHAFLHFGVRLVCNSLPFWNPGFHPLIQNMHHLMHHENSAETQPHFYLYLLVITTHSGGNFPQIKTILNAWHSVDLVSCLIYW